MSLSPALAADAADAATIGAVGPGLALAVASVLALLGYAWVGLLRSRAGDADAAVRRPLRSVPPMALAWTAQFVALYIDISGYGLAAPGARFGFAPALSMTAWLVLTVYLIESRFLPLHSVRRVLAWLAAAAVLLAWGFPGESRPTAASPWAPLHWVLGLASYGLFGVAVLHAALMNRAESQLRRKQSTPGGLPLLRLERLTFQFVAAGVGVLSLAIALGWWFTPQWRWDHKNLLAVLGWLVLTGLLVGRRIYGWRGRRATRWLYAGAALLLLSYAGSRFVLEVILQRGANGGRRMKYLLLLLLLAALFFVLGFKRSRPRDAQARKPQPPVQPQAMLSCAECGMHLPADESLPGKGGVFCSAAHRSSFEARQGQA